MMLYGCIIAIAALAPALPAQVPAARKVVVDTAKKKVVRHAKKRVEKEGVVRQQGGEVAVSWEESRALDSATAAGREAGLTNGREQARMAYERQRALDSVVNAILLSARIRRLEAAAMAARERDRQAAIARDEAAKHEAERVLREHLARGFYASLGGGASAPLRDTRNAYAGGWNGRAALGWDATEAPYGFRADLGIDRLNGTRYETQTGQLGAAGGNISVYSLTGNLKLRAHPAAVAETRSHLYAIGGIGIYKVTDAVYGPVGDKGGQRLSFNDARVNAGFNIGGGMALEVGRAELFVESRFVQIKTDLSYRVNGGVGTYTTLMPIVVGLNW